jgi:serine/threonine protein kinase
MGVVWEAESIDASRRVVVKTANISSGDRRITTERLLYESEVLRFLNDELEELTTDMNQRLIRQHVVRYVDRISDPENPLLVLEFVEGQTLTNVVRQRPITPEIATQYAIKLANVVGAIHTRGVVHRDISPSNILLSSRGLVLIDFGTCFVLRGKIRPPRYGNVIFKRGYSSPELLQGRSDERSDVFSTGATLFFLLTGKSPADYMTESQILTKAPNLIDKKISPTISEILETAMSTNPASRLQSAAALAAALEKSHGSQTGPRIVIGDLTFQLKQGYVDIGREHECDKQCKDLGFTRPTQIRIADPQRFIEKHHARLWVQEDGTCLLEDLKSVNKTALKSKSAKYTLLNPHDKVKLQDSDMIALAYSLTRGPYMTFQFRDE